MTIDVKVLATANLAVQMILLVVLGGAVLLARERKLGRHCTVMRFAVPVQIMAVLGVMLPSMYGYIKHVKLGPLFEAEIFMHHLMGLSVLALWIYINLIFLGFLRSRVKLKTMMRIALALWVTSIILGLHIYLLAYHG